MVKTLPLPDVERGFQDFMIATTHGGWETSEDEKEIVLRQRKRKCLKKMRRRPETSRSIFRRWRPDPDDAMSAEMWSCCDALVAQYLSEYEGESTFSWSF